MIIIIITLHHQDHNVLSSQAGFVISKIKNTFYFFFSIQPECPPLPPSPSYLCAAPAGTLVCHYTGDHCCCGQCSESFTLSCAHPDSTTGAGVWKSTLCPVDGCGSEGDGIVNICGPIIVKRSLSQVWSPHQTTLATIPATLRRPRRYKWRRD